MIFMNRPVCGVCGAPYDEENPERDMRGYIVDGEEKNVCNACMRVLYGTDRIKEIVTARRRKRHDD